jgi:hypothetical protein
MITRISRTVSPGAARQSGANVPATAPFQTADYGGTPHAAAADGCDLGQKT